MNKATAIHQFGELIVSELELQEVHLENGVSATGMYEMTATTALIAGGFLKVTYEIPIEIFDACEDDLPRAIWDDPIFTTDIVTLMNPHTGSVDTEENWKADSERDGWDYNEQHLLEVELDSEGNWTEIE